MSTADRPGEEGIYRSQGFGHRLGLRGPFALLIVDFVEGFADPTVFGGGNIPAAIAATVKALEEARRRGWPIAHSRVVFPDAAARENAFCAKVPSLTSLTEEARMSAIVAELTPIAGELVVRKTVPSAFFETNLRSWLTQQGIRTLLVAGTTTSGCVRASVVDALSCGFRPIVLLDCVGDRALGPHEASLFDMDQKYADVMSFSDFIVSLTEAERSAV